MKKFFFFISCKLKLWIDKFYFISKSFQFVSFLVWWDSFLFHTLCTSISTFFCFFLNLWTSLFILYLIKNKVTTAIKMMSKGIPIDKPIIKGTFLSQALMVAEMVLVVVLDWVLMQGFWFWSEMKFTPLGKIGGFEHLKLIRLYSVSFSTLKSTKTLISPFIDTQPFTVREEFVLLVRSKVREELPSTTRFESIYSWLLIVRLVFMVRSFEDVFLKVQSHLFSWFKVQEIFK